jgi:predicted Rossmann-fold nucleotide-binding protein
MLVLSAVRLTGPEHPVVDIASSEEIREGRVMKEIESLATLRAHLASNQSLAGVVLQNLDLRAESLSAVVFTGAVFLGCEFTEALFLKAHAEGALIFPRISGLPYEPYRGRLYDPEELYQGFKKQHPESYADSFDARVYAHWKRHGGAAPASILESLAQRLHDHAISDALEEFLENQGSPRKVVALMGGHSMHRGEPSYLAAAQMSRTLSRRGFCMASGGGPGAMEATHLGAYFAHRDDSDLQKAITLLERAPLYKDKGWLSCAFEVREKFPPDPEARYVSLGIPTWYYGHEPPNPFASHLAKYFANSIREEGLLTIATYGVIFTPGSAGTIQEIFQDACQNHYNTVGVVSPMIFFGEAYWKWQKPVFPLLAQLAIGNEYSRYISITDSQAQVVSSIEAFAAGRAALTY